MIYIDKNYLNIVYLEQECEYFNIYDLIQYIKYPRLHIYFYYKNKFLGFVTLDDIIYSINNNIDFVKINKNYFENVYKEEIIIKDNEFNGILIKGYNTSFYKTIFQYLLKFEVRDIFDFFKKICFVVSSDSYTESYVEFLTTLFKKNNCTISFCKYNEINFLENDYNAIIFEHDSEFEAFTKIQRINKQYYDPLVVFSLNFFIKDLDIRINNYHAKINFNYFYNYLKEKGVKVFPLYINFNNYVTNFDKALINKYKDKSMNRNGIVLDREKLFRDLYNESYCEKVLSAPFYNLVKKENFNVINDCYSDVLNIKDGCRITFPEYSDDDNININMYGNCLILGVYTDDKHTIASYLQRNILRENKKAKVINRGSFNDYVSELRQVMSTDLYKDDIVIIFNFEKVGKNIYNIDLSNEYENKDISINDFVDTIFHINHKVSNIFAERLYNEIEDEIKNDITERTLVEKNYDFFLDLYFDRYFDINEIKEYEKVGSIVMNCNPFTYGHQYLIETASKLVDKLIIFVVSEDKSEFSFYQRYAMVLNGTKHIDNVIVVPSGDYILSKDTFPEYFTKVADSDFKKNIINDLEIFCKKIAPKLNIKYRFAGTEPLDEITQNYNKMMEEVLGNYGIEFVVIDRKKVDNNYISAAIVRSLIHNKTEKDEILKYIPNTTYELIFSD